MNFELLTPVILVDLDGTIFENSERKYRIPPAALWHKEEAWREFNQACHSDTVVPEIHALIRALHRRYNIAYCTSRGLSAKEQTQKQLADCSLNFRTRCSLFMRRANDDRSAAEYKVEVVRKLTDQGFRVELAIDDNADVIRALYAAGVCTLQVHSRCCVEQLRNHQAGFEQK